jgi:hypothetical protein
MLRREIELTKVDLLSMELKVAIYVEIQELITRGIHQTMWLGLSCIYM